LHRDRDFVISDPKRESDRSWPPRLIRRFVLERRAVAQAGCGRAL
jgi:hypothetical protein